MKTRICQKSSQFSGLLQYFSILLFKSCLNIFEILFKRSSKDLIVSYYHFSRMNKLIGFEGDFDDFFDRFIKGTVPYGPVWEHYLDVLEWNQNHSKDDRILMISFDDLKRVFVNQM